MIRLSKTLAAWGTPAFADCLKRELSALGVDELPLQQGLTKGSYVGDDGFRVIVISVAEEASNIQAKIGVFFTGIIAGCSCADDPTPVEGQPEYCEVRVQIDKASAEAMLSLVPG